MKPTGRINNIGGNSGGGKKFNDGGMDNLLLVENLLVEVVVVENLLVEVVEVVVVENLLEVDVEKCYCRHRHFFFLKLRAEIVTRHLLYLVRF